MPVNYMAATDADVPRARGHAHDVHNLAVASGVQSIDTDVSHNRVELIGLIIIVSQKMCAELRR